MFKQVYDGVSRVSEVRFRISFRVSMVRDRARQLYNNVSMLFLFPVIDGKLSTGVNATLNASCYV